MVAQVTDPLHQHLQAALSRVQRSRRVPSLAVCVLRDAQPAWTGAVGHLGGRTDTPAASPETPYRIGSITKSLVAVAVLQLVRDGLLDLHDPLTHHLPEVGRGLRRVTVGSLLSHSSGLYAETEGPWWERSNGRTWEELLPSIRRRDQLATGYHYSNVGYAIAGELVARTRALPWFEVVKKSVLLPLGMRHTTYDRPSNAAQGWSVHPHADVLHREPTHDAGAMAPAGQLWSTVGDLTAFAQFLVRGDAAVLPDQLRLAMQLPSVVVDVPGAPWDRAYGLGLEIANSSGRRFIGHGGSMPGYRAAVRVDPVSGDGFALLANTTHLDTDFGYSLLDELDRVQPKVATPWVADEPGHDLGLTGTWFWGPRPYTLTMFEGLLELTPDGSAHGFRFLPEPEGDWTGLDDYFAGETLQRRRAPDGTDYLDLASFRLTRTPYDPKSDIPGGTDPDGWH